MLCDCIIVRVGLDTNKTFTLHITNNIKARRKNLAFFNTLKSNKKINNYICTKNKSKRLKNG